MASAVRVGAGRRRHPRAAPRRRRHVAEGAAARSRPRPPARRLPPCRLARLRHRLRAARLAGTGGRGARADAARPALSRGPLSPPRAPPDGPLGPADAYTAATPSRHAVEGGCDPHAAPVGGRRNAYGCAFARLRLGDGRARPSSGFGFFDTCIVGGGDRAMIAAAYGCLRPRRRPPEDDAGARRAISRLGRAASGAAIGRRGRDISRRHLPSLARAVEKRRMRERYEEIAALRLRSGARLRRAESGAWQWNSDKPALHETVAGSSSPATWTDDDGGSPALSPRAIVPAAAGMRRCDGEMWASPPINPPAIPAGGGKLPTLPPPPRSPADCRRDGGRRRLRPRAPATPTSSSRSLAAT